MYQTNRKHNENYGKVAQKQKTFCEGIFSSRRHPECLT